MQKIIYICDRCGEEIGLKRYRLEIIETDSDATISGFDLCESCREQIADLILPPPPSKTPQAKKKGREKIDRGKVMALHNAGWKVKDIAGEMNLENSQISQVIYQEKKKLERGGIE